MPHVVSMCVFHQPIAIKIIHMTHLHTYKTVHLGTDQDAYLGMEALRGDISQPGECPRASTTDGNKMGIDTGQVTPPTTEFCTLLQEVSC